MKNSRRHKDVKSIKRTALAAVAAAGIALPTALHAQETVELDEIVVISATPLFGSELDIDKIPTPVTSISAEDFSNVPTATPQNVLQQNAPGVIVVDLQGSDFQNEIRFRGFAASPVNGVPQGLAVYQNGIRINESFGDIVNFDFLPEGAIESMDLQTANPIFGLNAIGGSLNIKMRDGFTFQGVETTVEAGSFGRKKGSIAGGTLSESGNFAAFVALDVIDDDGYRDFSESSVKRVYADIGYRTNKAEFHVNYTGASNELGVVAATPESILEAGGWDATFTSPQVTEKEMSMFSINGKVDITPEWTGSGLGYYRRYSSNVLDGNLAEFEPCETTVEGGPDDGDPIELEFPDDTAPGVIASVNGDPENFLCGEVEKEDDDYEAPVLFSGGAPIEALDGVEAYGSIDRITQDYESWGSALQAAHNGNIFGRNNKFIVGGSYDYGEGIYTAKSEIGEITENFVVEGSGIIIEEGGEFTPRRLRTENTYLGAYFLNVTELTDQLTLSVGGRYNYAEIDMKDLTGNFPNLTTVNTYERFNPSVGATYEILPGLSFFGSYAEANRAPTAAELGCAEPDAPCPIESFLTDDPPLEQVVTRTYEGGIRGRTNDIFGGTNSLSFSVGYFHAVNEDDILSIASEEQGRGYFDNVGDTKREGIEASVKFQSDRVRAYANYSYTEATFEDSFEVPWTGNIGTDGFACVEVDEGICIPVQPGDRIPGIPEHLFKAGIDFNVTQRWMVGADLLVTSDQVFLGDEGNFAPTLAGYEKVDIRTSYDISDRVQIYGKVENIFDKRYGLFGNFFQVEEPDEVAEAAGYEEDDLAENGTTIVPSKPVSAYVGIKIKLN